MHAGVFRRSACVFGEHSPATGNLFQNGLEAGLLCSDLRRSSNLLTNSAGKQQEAGGKVADLCRKHGISEETFCASDHQACLMKAGKPTSIPMRL